MKVLALVFALLATPVSAADFEGYNSYDLHQRNMRAQTTYAGMIERRINAYTTALIIETVQERCFNYLKFDMPRDKVIPNKQYFIVGFDPPVQQQIIDAAKIRATKYSDSETFRKGLNPGQIMSDGAWCRLVAPELLQNAKDDMWLYMD